jgi:hypothetical protein
MKDQYVEHRSGAACQALFGILDGCFEGWRL